MSAKRDEAARILARVPKTIEGIRSDKQPDLFFDWTGYRHKDMLEDWDNSKNGERLLTACGGFASKFAGLIGITNIPQGIFKLQQSLNESGKSHAWVPASSGARPNVGDILRHTIFHVDVAAGWDGPKLIRVAAGQSHHPRPTTSVDGEFDALKWVTGKAPYNPANLQGWLDLDLYFGAGVSPSVNPTLGWLNGWWKVWDGNTYWYHFGSNGIVKYTKTQPASFGFPPKFANNNGCYTYNAPALVVTWNKIPSAAAACRETFYNAEPGCRKMNAYSNLYGPLEATKAG